MNNIDYTTISKENYDNYPLYELYLNKDKIEDVQLKEDIEIFFQNEENVKKYSDFHLMDKSEMSYEFMKGYWKVYPEFRKYILEYPIKTRDKIIDDLQLEIKGFENLKETGEILSQYINDNRYDFSSEYVGAFRIALIDYRSRLIAKKLQQEYDTNNSLESVIDIIGVLEALIGYHEQNLNNPFFKDKDTEKYILTLLKRMQSQWNLTKEKLQNKIKPKISNYPKYIFVSEMAFEIFMEYRSNYIVEPFIDFSFIFYRLKEDNLLVALKQKDFLKWMLENNYCTEKVENYFIKENGWRSKCYSNARENNYNIILKKYQ